MHDGRGPGIHRAQQGFDVLEGVSDLLSRVGADGPVWQATSLAGQKRESTAGLGHRDHGVVAARLRARARTQSFDCHKPMIGIRTHRPTQDWIQFGTVS